MNTLPSSISRPRSLLSLAGCLLLAFLGACSGGGGNSEPSDNEGPSDPPPQQQPSSRTFIQWVGSANGTAVVEASNERVYFYSDTGTMSYRGVEVLNVGISRSADLFWQGADIGGLAYIRSMAGGVITGLVSNRGTMLDLFVSGGTLFWRDSGIPPVFASQLAPEEGQLRLSGAGAHAAFWSEPAVDGELWPDDDAPWRVSDDDPVEDVLSAEELPLEDPEQPSQAVLHFGG